MNIDIICPLYNAEKHLLNLHNSLLMQKDVDINSINYALTRSSDNTQKILDDNQLNYTIFEKEEFSHSYTREVMAKKSNADIIVFISQDIVIKRVDWLKKLTEDICNNKCDASYSRQLASKNNIEKYTREKNYGDKSFIKTKEDIPVLGLNTFFFQMLPQR